jgi:hypothetical protein
MRRLLSLWWRILFYSLDLVLLLWMYLWSPSFFLFPLFFFFFSHPAQTLFLSLFLFFLLLPSPAVHPLTGSLRRFPSHSFSPPSHDQTDSASSNFPFSLSLCQPPLGPRIEFQIFEGFGTHRRTGKPLLLFISISALPSL